MAGVPGYPPDRLFPQLLNTGLAGKDQPLYQLLYLMIQQLLKLTQVTSGLTPGVIPGGNTIINQVIQQIIDGDGSGGGSGDVIPGPPGVPGEDGENGMVPYHIFTGETFTVPIYKQALFSMNIDNEGTLEIDGFLIEVDDDAYAMQDGNNAFTGQNSFDNFPIDLLYGQIKFPATDNPSSDLNTLDDYEEGDFELTDASGAGLVFVYAYGTYIKIGKSININWQVVYPPTADGSDAVIQGLPFLVNFFSNSACAVGFQTCTQLLNIQLINGTDTIVPIDAFGLVNIINSDLNNGNILAAGSYPNYL
jgi:hypothetical protein